jgi:serine/threonine-protein kinase
VLGDRYRVVGMLGKGGMGEVYRADDLKLGQPVALKFLPEELTGDPSRRARFLDEARVALKVTHPNVCRVHDIGEEDGHPYISMEYIDGEDLASLLRRIGRLPEDKAIEIARQLCAGLAAAHDQGILHRDLKPANVMLDGRGRARITDFGLAGLEQTFEGGEVRSGTPAYMSPEQLEGKEVTVRSEIYALGLVLYELFTGKQAFVGKTPGEMARLHRESAPTTPTSHVSGLDPAVESVLLRCLEKDPASRPASVAAVAASLPGGDPLAAALAAGETPSPELVAAAGESNAMSPVLALALLVVSLAVMVAAATFAASDDLMAYMTMETPPAALEDRAREVIRKLGYTEPIYSDPGDSASGFFVDSGYLNHIEEHDDSPDRWTALSRPQPSFVEFWYRQTPGYYFPSPAPGSIAPPRVARFNPVPIEAGEITVGLDLSGRLTFFAVPTKRWTPEPPPTGEPDWSPLFELAGIDIAGFEPVEPRYHRWSAPDQRAAWIGRLPEVPDIEVVIEAAMHDGRFVNLQLLWPWHLETYHRDPEHWGLSTNDKVGGGIFFTILALGALIARRNLKRDRADRRGALRLVVAAAVLGFFIEYLRTHPSLNWNPNFVFFALGSTLMIAAVAGMFYVALEPYARRIWPTILLSWSRLVGGDTVRWRDPAVGRSIIAGIVGAAVYALLVALHDVVSTWVLGGPVKPPLSLPNMTQRTAISGILEAVQGGMIGACLWTFVLVLARFLMRRGWLAAVVVVAVFGPLTGIQLVGVQASIWISIGWGVANLVLTVAVLLRFGFLAGLVMFLGNQLFRKMIVPDWSGWYAQPSITVAVALVLLAAYGYWSATAGRQLIPEEA